MGHVFQKYVWLLSLTLERNYRSKWSIWMWCEMGFHV